MPPETVTLPVKLLALLVSTSVPAPSLVTLPVPLIVPPKVWEPERFQTSSEWFAMLPASEPPSSRRVPLLMVVPPV